jgi:hypothetical protein
VRESVKVSLGVLAITIGASAPTLILESIFFRSIYQIERPCDRNIRASNQELSHPYTQNEHSAPASPSAETTRAHIAQDHTVKDTNQSEQNNPEPRWVPVAQGLSAIVGLIVAAVIALINFAQWAVYNRQARIMTRQLVMVRMSVKAARTSADIAARTLTASHRAWIKADVDIGNEPASFERGGASVPVLLKLENIGNAPAVNITTHIWLVPFSGGSSPTEALRGSVGPFPTQIQRRRREEIRRKSFDPISFTLFPNESFKNVSGGFGLPYRLNIISSEMAGGYFGNNNELMSLFVVGFVDYTFHSDLENHHQTGFVYRLYKTAHPIHLIVDEGQIPPGGLQLIPDMLGMGRDAD